MGEDQFYNASGSVIALSFILFPGAKPTNPHHSLRSRRNQRDDDMSAYLITWSSCFDPPGWLMLLCFCQSCTIGRACCISCFPLDCSEAGFLLFWSVHCWETYVWPLWLSGFGIGGVGARFGPRAGMCTGLGAASTSRAKNGRAARRKEDEKYMITNE